jgi:DNA-binding transcriptional LysR family regulator
VTFGEQCFYTGLSEPMLAAAGIDHTVAFSASSISGVVAALRAGLGVGVLGSRYLNDDLVEWAGAADLPALPRVHQIARTVPGDPPAVTAALIDAISDELLEVPAAVA